MKSRFTQEAVRQIVQESRALGVTLVAHKHNISEQTLYNWRKRFKITNVSARIGELKRLQLENARLKRMVAERDLEIDVMKETAAGNVVSMTEHLDAESDELWLETSSSSLSAKVRGELSVVGNT